MMENPFSAEKWSAFWTRIEQEWAKQEKRELHYPFDGVNDPDLGED